MGLQHSKADSSKAESLIVEHTPAVDFSKTIAVDDKADVQVKRLKFITYNVWFETDFIDTRMPALFKLMEEENADVICLQEVLPRFIKAMCEQEWIRKNYVISDSLGFSVIPYGVLILTKIPSILQLKMIPTLSGMSRRLLTLEFRVNHTTVKVGTMHFESLDFSDLRRDQIKLSCDELATDCTNSFLMGDFNFGEQHEMEEKSLADNILANGWKDTWRVLKPNDPGCTIDVNYPHRTYKPARFDRVLVKSDQWHPIDVKLIGDQRLGTHITGKAIFPSDHLGLVAEFEWQDAAEQSNQN